MVLAATPSSKTSPCASKISPCALVGTGVPCSSCIALKFGRDGCRSHFFREGGVRFLPTLPALQKSLSMPGPTSDTQPFKVICKIYPSPQMNESFYVHYFSQLLAIDWDGGNIYIGMRFYPNDKCVCMRMTNAVPDV